MAAAPTVQLNNGLKMPAFGLGTMQFYGDEGVRAVRDAIDAGYRHMDSAYVYGNEADVGRAIREKVADGVVTREDMFFTTKLWCTFHDPALVEHACRKSLANSGLDYIDLYLMHFPVGFEHRGNDAEVWPKNADGSQACNDVDYVDTWLAMEKLVGLGLVKSIGLSNFNSEQIERVLAAATIRPVANQIECSPTFNQKKLLAFCKKHDIVVIGYSPLGRPDPVAKTPKYLFDAGLDAIASRLGKNSVQIVLRYLYESGAVAIPKSVKKSRIEQNINIFDFELSAEDRAYIDGFQNGKRLVNLSDAKHSKYWPFGIEY